jgi:hypothetical protein
MNQQIIILAIIIVLGLIIGIIAFVILSKSSKTKKTKKRVIKEESENTTIELDELMDIVKNPDSSSQDILNVLELFNKNFTIDETNGQKEIIFLSRALTHRNVNKDIFNYFHKEIKTKNPKYKKELELIERKALG